MIATRSSQPFTIAVVTPDALPPALRAMPNGVTPASLGVQPVAPEPSAMGGDEAAPLLATVNATLTRAVPPAPQPLAQQLARAAPPPVVASNPILLQSAAYNPAIFMTNQPVSHTSEPQLFSAERVMPLETRSVATPAVWQKKQHQVVGLSVVVIQVGGVPRIDIRPYYDDEELN